MKKHKIVLYFLCLISLFACVNETQQSKEVEEVIKEDSEILKDKSIVYSDSAIIKGKLYKAFFKTDEYFYIIQDEDTIMKEIDLNPFFQFEDFNEDGNKDIGFSCMSCAGINGYYLFDSTTTNFNKLINSNQYHELKKIDKNYYYSYRRNGCADLNWLSYLVQIKNFKVIPLAYIYGQGCEADRDYERKMEVFKFSEKDSIDGKLYQTLPINLIENYEDHKWGFIKEYWSNNYQKFVK